MRKLEIWLAGPMVAAALLAPMALLEPLCLLRSVATNACADGSANLVMGCASILL